MCERYYRCSILPRASHVVSASMSLQYHHPTPKTNLTTTLRPKSLYNSDQKQHERFHDQPSKTQSRFSLSHSFSTVLCRAHSSTTVYPTSRSSDAFNVQPYRYRHSVENSALDQKGYFWTTLSFDVEEETSKRKSVMGFEALPGSLGLLMRRCSEGAC